MTDRVVAEQRVKDNLERLNNDVRALDAHCRLIAHQEVDSTALVEFKRLMSRFDDVTSFVTVLETQASFVDDDRRREVELYLQMLLQRLAALHLSTAEGLLLQVVNGDSPLPLGTRYVMERWLVYLSRLESQVAGPPPGPEQGRNMETVARVRMLAQALAERAPDLPDFSEPSLALPAPVRHTSRPAAAPREQAKPKLRLVLIGAGSRATIDPRSSAAVLVELRRLNIPLELSNALGIHSTNLVMVLNGRDPFMLDRLDHLVSLLKRHLGEEALDVVVT